MYAITATVTTEFEQWFQTREIPTFYLDENVQGIVSEEHAVKIAKTIVDPFDSYEAHVSAVKL